MAEAKEISGLDCNASAAPWASKVLLVRFAEVLELRITAKDFSEVESVHDMRVAIRRLRGALRDFEPLLKKRSLKNIRQNLKHLADALGAVRDQDVAVIALKKLLANINDKVIKTGIENLVTERERLREQNRNNLVEILADGDLATLENDFAKVVERAVKNKKLTFNQAGKVAVGDSLRQFLKLGASLYDPFETEELHEMRIAAKRLRYALELFTACWGENIKSSAAEIARMQTALGEVHDCDVWIAESGNLLRGENGKTQEKNQNERQAAIWLLLEYTKKRTKYYRDALKLWGEWEQTDFAAKMQIIIESID